MIKFNSHNFSQAIHCVKKSYSQRNRVSIFKKIKNSLKSENNVNYNKFLKKIEFDEKNSTSTHLIIKAPNIFIANFIKRKYKNKILELYEKETGIKPLIEIITK